MIYADFYKGIAPSKKFQNKWDDMQNCDVHSELGSLLCQKALEKKSGTLIDAGCYTAVVPNGDTYFFSKTDGKIWKRTQLGVYSSVRTGGHGAYKGATYYRNYLYYSMDAFLGRFNMASTWNDNFQVLTAGKDHPLNNFDLILYIGNGKDIAQVDDADAYTTSALDLPLEYNVSDMIPYGDDLLTIANPGNYITDAGIFRWNTYSDSWSVKDSIKEINAYTFIDADNNVYVICQNGNVYYYNGNKLVLFSFIRNTVATYGHQLSTNFQGKPLIANGGKIYSIYKRTNDMPIALVGEYTCSQGKDATIHSIVANGANLLVSWEFTTGGVTTFGIDEISSGYADATIITPRFSKNGSVQVYYDVLNDGTIEIESKLDGGTWATHLTYDDLSDKRMVKTEDDLIVPSGAQARITIKPSLDKTQTPVIDKINISN